MNVICYFRKIEVNRLEALGSVVGVTHGANVWWRTVLTRANAHCLLYRLL